MITNAKQRANAKYNENKYDRIQTNCLKGKKDIYIKMAEKMGYISEVTKKGSLAAIVEDMLDLEAAKQGFGEEIKAINGGTVTRQREQFLKAPK